MPQRSAYQGPRPLPGHARPRLHYPPRVEPEPAIDPEPPPEPMIDPCDLRYVTMGGEWCILPHDSRLPGRNVVRLRASKTQEAGMLGRSLACRLIIRWCR